MSVYCHRTRFTLLTLFALCLTASLATNAIGADPKVVKASHVASEKVLPKESDQSDDDEIAYSPQWPEPPNTGAMLFRLCMGTVAVLALCVGTLWFGKPWLQKLQIAGTGSPALYIEGSVAVGNRAMLYLVRVGATQLIAGTDATGLKSLIAVPTSFKDVLDEEIADAETPVATSPGPFSAKAGSRLDSKE